LGILGTSRLQLNDMGPGSHWMLRLPPHVGQRRMTDLAFQNVVSYRKDEMLFYETELITDLLRDITRSL
jgi:hypothetical protein